jgi:hypothetical protein
MGLLAFAGQMPAFCHILIRADARDRERLAVEAADEQLPGLIPAVSTTFCHFATSR